MPVTSSTSGSRVVMVASFAAAVEQTAAKRAASGVRTRTAVPDARRGCWPTGASAMTRPRPSTMMWSAVCAISLIRCEERNTVRPSAARCRARLRTQITPSGSRPFTGSSRMSVPGSPSRAAAMPSRWPMPSEKPPTRLRATDSQTGERDHLVDAGAADAVGRREREQVVLGAASGVHGLRIQQHADLAKRGAQLRVVQAADRHVAGGRPVESDDQAHRRRLAGAVRPEESGHHPRSNGEGHVIDGGLASVTLGQPGGFDHVLRLWGCRSRQISRSDEIRMAERLGREVAGVRGSCSCSPARRGSAGGSGRSPGRRCRARRACRSSPSRPALLRAQQPAEALRLLLPRAERARHLDRDGRLGQVDREVRDLRDHEHLRAARRGTPGTAARARRSGVAPVSFGAPSASASSSIWSRYWPITRMRSPACLATSSFTTPSFAGAVAASR